MSPLKASDCSPNCGSGELAPLLEQMYRILLCRDNFDDDLLEKVAGQVDYFTRQIRELYAEDLRESVPATAFYPGHLFLQEPALDQQAVTKASGALASRRQSDRETSGDDVAGESGKDQRPLSSYPVIRLNRLLAKGVLSVKEIVSSSLSCIESQQNTINAFVTVLTADAKKAAERCDQELLKMRRRGDRPDLLFGIPVAVKDLIHIAGVPTTAGSAVMKDFVPKRDATLVRRLASYGAIIVGKTATHEFAAGSTTDTPFHGPVRNPWQLNCTAGGSSGGAGASVAAGMVPISIGTDTGGSIRIPATACGVVGFKPTYGRISLQGVIPLSWSLDHAGPLSLTVADAIFSLLAMQGKDPLDHRSIGVANGDDLVGVVARRGAGLKGIRIGVPVSWAYHRVHPDVAKCFDRALETFRELGAQVDEVPAHRLPSLEAMFLVQQIIRMGESASYHAPLLATKGELYSEKVRLRFESSQFLLAKDYVLAQRLRSILIRQTSEAMHGFHVWLLPGLPLPAPELGRDHWCPPSSPMESLSDAFRRFNSAWNLTGQPALAVPMGLSNTGLPVGLQIIGRAMDDATVLRVGMEYELARGEFGLPAWTQG